MERRREALAMGLARDFAGPGLISNCLETPGAEANPKRALEELKIIAKYL